MSRNALLSFAALALCAAPAVAQTPCYSEYGDNVFADNVSMGGPNLIVAIKFVAPSSFTVTSMQIFTGEGAGTNKLAIYSHDAGLNQPLASLGSGTWSMTSTNSWQGATTAPIALSAGTTYWIGWSPINGAQASVDTSIPGNGQEYRGSFDNGGSWSGPFTNSNHWKFKLFGNCSTCTAKTNSLGCVPVIGGAGTPSATSGSGFVVSATNEFNNKAGLLFYGITGSASIPFQGGTLCVNPPIRRTPASTSGGTPPPVNNCTGVFSIDMNAFAVGSLGGNPIGALTVSGTVVNCQWWGRDPGFAAPNNTSLSDGLQYTVGP
jgi:hypothetical protein